MIRWSAGKPIHECWQGRRQEFQRGELLSQLRADPEIYFGGQTKFFNRKLRANPESSAKRLIIESGARTRAKPKKNGGRGMGRGVGEPLLRNILRNRT